MLGAVIKFCIILQKSNIKTIPAKENNVLLPSAESRDSSRVSQIQISLKNQKETQQ